MTEKNQDIRELTVRTGFVFYHHAENGTVKQRTGQGQKVKIDINSKEFEGQKIKFVEFANGTLIKKQSKFKPPINARKVVADKQPVDVDSRKEERLPKFEEPQKEEPQKEKTKRGSKKVQAEDQKKTEEPKNESLVSAENFTDGEFPKTASNFDFSTADRGFLDAWAITAGIDIGDDASDEEAVELIKKALA